MHGSSEPRIPQISSKAMSASLLVNLVVCKNKREGIFKFFCLNNNSFVWKEIKGAAAAVCRSWMAWRILAFPKSGPYYVINPSIYLYQRWAIGSSD